MASALAHSGFCLPLPALLTMLPPPGSLEPDEDPLCMLLLIDHLALRARSYEYLIRLFEEWEGGVRTGQAGWGLQGGSGADPSAPASLPRHLLTGECKRRGGLGEGTATDPWTRWCQRGLRLGRSEDTSSPTDGLQGGFTCKRCCVRCARLHVRY